MLQITVGSETILEDSVTAQSPARELLSGFIGMHSVLLYF